MTPAPTTVRSILFLCTGNACRSQMAEGFAHAMMPKGWRVYSAGTMAAGVHPFTVAVMKEIGIDIADQYSKTVEELPLGEIDYVVTLCGNARNRCPVFPRTVTREHWPIDDPVGAIGGEGAMDAFRRVRDDIKHRMEELAEKV